MATEGKHPRISQERELTVWGSGARATLRAR